MTANATPSATILRSGVTRVRACVARTGHACWVQSGRHSHPAHIMTENARPSRHAEHTTGSRAPLRPRPTACAAQYNIAHMGNTRRHYLPPHLTACVLHAYQATTRPRQAIMQDNNHAPLARQANFRAPQVPRAAKIARQASTRMQHSNQAASCAPRAAHARRAP